MAQHSDLVYQIINGANTNLLVLLMLSLLLHLAKTRSSSKHAAKRRLPPSPPGLPVIGHVALRDLVNIRDHVALRDLAAKHGDPGGLMLLRLGAVRYLVASSPGAARAVLRTHDHIMASRPPTTLPDDILLYGSSDLVFTPYGELWWQMKKLVTTHMFSVKKVQSYRLARQEEVRLVIDKLREAAYTSTAIDLSEMIGTFSNDLMCRALSGKFSRGEGRSKILRELTLANSAFFASFNLEMFFPRLAKADLLTRFNARNKTWKVNRRCDDVLEMLLQNHERKSTASDAAEEESDFIDVLLSVQHEYNGITRDHIKAMLMDMFGVGTDTSFFVLDVAMAELMRRPKVIAKLQAEVRNDTPIGQEMVEEENLANMAYLKAVVKETLRLHPPLPLLLPHLSMADLDDVVHGYTVPSGTRVFINAWPIGRDPDTWERPGEFLPERSMEGGSATSADFRGNDFGLVPFGAGRRICPGLNFGMAAVEIMLANLVYRLDWALPPGMEKEDIDMTEVFGISVTGETRACSQKPRKWMITPWI